MSRHFSSNVVVISHTVQQFVLFLCFIDSCLALALQSFIDYIQLYIS